MNWDNNIDIVYEIVMITNSLVSLYYLYFRLVFISH